MLSVAQNRTGQTHYPPFAHPLFQLITGPNWKHLGQRVHQAREELGISQERLGELTGMKQQVISQLEIGNRQVTVAQLVKLSSVLEKSITFFLDDEIAHVADWEVALLEEFRRLTTPEARHTAIRIIKEIANLCDQNT